MNTSPSLRRGVMLVALSALAFSFAGIFTKAVEAPAWEVIFWRGLSGAIFTVAFLALRSGVKDELARFTPFAFLAACVGGIATACFLSAFKHTSVANVTLIWATAPFVSAVLSWGFIGERPSAKTLACSAFALTGVGITLQGSYTTGSQKGDILALGMTFFMSLMMVMFRARPDTPTKLPAALSSIVLLPFALMLATPLQTSGLEVGMLTLFGLVFALASVLLLEGARLVPTAQAALIGALETPLAPLWAIIVLAEWPTLSTVIDGTIVFAAVLASQLPFRKAMQHGL
ncbi:DMT family transporter [Lentibacter algarum]|uniref:DMT family transporter n=1 Tax=Lentibacter algarum TaxID=576131 RepID=UPI001C08FE44|nr:DMT family transporter [Lentibacter algarum]MBU2982909.1 DMT family transporter [Lentibacter algarum]